MTETVSEWIREGETAEDLQRNGLWLLQKKDGFRFGMDAVLLADFVRLRPRDKAADFGTGTGILPVLMSQDEMTACFHAIEIQPEMAEMAGRSVRMNHLENRISVHQADLRLAWELLGRESMDAVVCNPPYGKAGTTLLSEGENQMISRHETDCSLEEICRAAASVLVNHGRFYLVFPAPRLLELCDALRSARLEPKRIRMVCAKASKPPYVVLLEAVKNAKPSLLWEKPLIVYREEGTETDELKRIYHMA